MAKYKIFIKPSAVKELKKISDPDFTRIAKKVKKLSLNTRPKRCEKLSYEEKYRIRQGYYRTIYLIDDDALEVTVYKIGHRRNGYK